MSAELGGAPPAALFSLHDRRGSVELARAFVTRGLRIYATSGTRAHLVAHGVDARDVEELTGFPPLFDGRVKTLHPRVFGGILADRNDPAHRAQAEAQGVPAIVAVVVNLYPFEATVARGGATLDEAIEQIDIGGVALIRAAAKNFEQVTVLVDPAQYELVCDNAEIDSATRRRLATRAFERTAEYDSSIARYLEAGLLARELPGSLALTLPLATPLRYGENPQSRAAFYLARTETLPEQLGGKALSYNNLLDLDATLRLLVREVPRDFAAQLGGGAAAHGPSAPHSGRSARTTTSADENVTSADENVTSADENAMSADERAARVYVRAVVVKHTVPCGVAERGAAVDAVCAALEVDAVSAYGGIIALDGRVDTATADALAPFFLEIVAAPAFDDDALAQLRRKKSLRIMRYDARLPQRLAAELRVRSALGGVLAEDDDPGADPERWRIVSARKPSARECIDLGFAWDIVRHVKSNGVVISRDGITRGICAGQTNRVSAVRIAGSRAAEFARGAACASDGFFPFADGLEAAAAAGCAAVIAPEGSIRDADVIAAADRLGITLVFSTHRYFLH